MDPENALAYIHVIFPETGEQVFPVSQSTFTIGRVAPNELVLPSTKVSRLHARLLLEGDRMYLIDLNSSNGTLVADTKLTPNQPYPLAFGEVFRVGPYLLHLEPASIPTIPPAHPPATMVEIEPQATRLAAEEVPSPPPSEPEGVPPSLHIGVMEMPPPPPTEPPASPPAEGLPSYDQSFGIPDYASTYMQYLPPIYQEHPFLGRFLLSFEQILTPIEQMVDNFNLYLDPHTTPAYFLDYLAFWLGLTLDEKWPLEKRRQVIAEAAELYRRRGTRWSLSRHLEIYTGVAPEIREPEKQPHHFVVVLRLPRGANVDRAIVERIIQANKPAHTTYQLDIQTV